MGISLRHFIITITAIFLSLGIGIFIGAIMDSQHLFIEQQKQLVSQIEDEFDSFKEKNYQLLTEVENYKKEKERETIFINNVYNHLIENSLKGLNILIVNVSDEDILSDISSLLKEAGVNNVSYITINDMKEIDEYGKNDSIQREVKSSVEISYKNKAQIVKEDLHKVFTNKYEEDNNYLSENMSINIIGEINQSINYIILFDGNYKNHKKERDMVRKSVIGVLSETNIPLVTVEKSNAIYSLMPYYKKLGISTVDNIDTYIGKISMLMLMRENQGSYGENQTTNRLIP